MTIDTITFTVEEGSTFIAADRFKNQNGGKVVFTDSTFSAGTFYNNNNTSEVSFTNATVNLRGGFFLKDQQNVTTDTVQCYSLENIGIVDIKNGTKFTADTDTNSKGVKNSGTINVTQSDVSAKIWTNAGTLNITGGVPSLTLTGITADPTGKTITVKDSNSTTVATGYVINATEVTTETAWSTVFVSPGLVADNSYTVTIGEGEGETVFNDQMAATTLPLFTVTDTFTNNSGKTVTVTNAAFEAGTLSNSGTITVTDSTFTAETVTIAGTFTVKGTSELTIGTNTGTLTGTIKTDSAAATTLNASNITGNATNGGAITAQNDLTFTGANTLENITLTANTSGKTVTVSGPDNTLTVKGTSKLTIGTLVGEIKTDTAATALNASNITGKIDTTNNNALLGTITAQNDLTFTGANTLKNITFDATGKTVTVSGSDNSLTVKGTSKLMIGTLDGEIKTDSAAATTLDASNITGKVEEGNLLGTITAQNTLNFAGTNTLNSVTLSAAGKTVKINSGATLTVGEKSTLTIGTLDGTIKTAAETTLNASSITGKVSGSSIPGTLDAQGDLTFTGYNVLTNINLSADEKTVNINSGATLTVGGKSTLNITSLGGTIELLDGAEIRNSTVSNGGTLNVGTHEVESVATGNNVSFTGVNDFASAITNLGAIAVTNATLKAASVDTSATGASFTVGGKSTLTIGTLDGTITTNSAAATTLNASNITGKVDGENLLGTITAQNNLNFTGANTLNSVTLSADEKTVKINSGATLTVDNSSRLTADTITNQGGTIKLTYNGASIDCITVTNPINNTVDGTTKIQGSITIDISALQPKQGTTDEYARTKIADFIVASGQEGTIHLVRGSDAATDVDYEIVRDSGDENGIWIKDTSLNPDVPPTYLFVNAAWKDSRPSSITYAPAGGNVSLTFAGKNHNAFYSVQDAIDAAKAYKKETGNDCTIVFYKTSDSKCLDFLNQGTITVNTNVTFETNVAASDITAVKMDSLHINTESTATFRNGLYSMEDYIDNSGTLKVLDYAKFNANMIGNENGTVLVDTTSRIVSDAIEKGDIQLEIIDGTSHKINGLDPWIIRPISSIVDDPEADIVVPVPGGGEKTFLDVKKGDKLVRDNESGNYYIYRDGKYYSALGKDSDSCTEAAAPSDITVWDCTDQYRGLYLVSDVFDLRETTANSGVYWSNTIYVDNDFKAETTSFTTEGGKTVKATFSDGTEETADPTADTGVYAFKSFVSAFNSVYSRNHSVGKENEGLVIRLRAGTYDEKNSQLDPDFTLQNNVIIEPDKTDGTTYDEVTLELGGLWKEDKPSNVRLMEFSHLKSLTIGGKEEDSNTDWANKSKNWHIGTQSVYKKKETGVLSFVDIGTLTINGTLKAQDGATVRIINCADVTSNKHLSVVGGTFIFDNSNITLVGSHSDRSPYTKNGAISTENKDSGTGNIIVRNSTFVVEGTSTATDPGLYVNLKTDAEFMITGTCTVNGVFTNANESGANSKTTITFSNATLDENTKIQAGDPAQGGAALKFDGYNTLDGTTVAQNGNRNMTVEAGATVNMTNEASISVGGSVNVQNCGSISLDNSSISAGSFDNTGSLTLTNGSTVNLGDGTFTNQVNGVLTVDLQGDGGIGVTAGGITNYGLIQIDLSHTDYPPEAITIDILGLNNSDGGTVTVIGGGGTAKEKKDDSGKKYIQILLNDPQTQTLYVNGTWDPDNAWIKGKNVGSRMYYGYNSFKDNPGATDDYRSMTFAGDTDKVVYFGGSQYNDFSIESESPQSITLTTLAGTAIIVKPGEDDPVHYIRETAGDMKLVTAKNGSVQYYAWKYGTNRFIYTETLNIKTGSSDTSFYNYQEVQTPEDTIVYYSVVAGTPEITVGEDDYIRDSADDYQLVRNGSTVSYYAWKKNDDVVYTDTISIKSESDEGSHYYKLYYSVASFSKDSTTRTIELAGDTARMGAFTVAGGQAVTLSGATMSQSTGKEITNSGTLNVGTGESAKLTLSVAKSKVTRDVKVRIIATNGAEEYQTISVPAETDPEKENSTVVVKSGSFIVGQPYTVEVTDMHQCSYEKDKQTNESCIDVAVVKTGARNVKIIVCNAQGAKYTYSNYNIQENKSSVKLTNPGFGSIGIVDDDSPFTLDYNSETGQLKLKAGDEAIDLAKDTIVRVQGTNGTCQFDYSYVVKQGSYAAHDTIDDKVNANFGTGYYYVEVEEASVSESAEVDSISGSVVTAQDVTNNGTLTVASQKVFGVEDEEAKRKSAKLVLDVDKNNVARWITVKAGSTDYSMYVAANESKAVLASEDFKVGTSISGVTVFDSFTRTVTAKDGKLVIDGLVADDNPRDFTVKYGSSDIALNENNVTYNSDRTTTATISGVSGITDGHEYSVTVTDKRTVSAEAEGLAEFTAANVTNNANATITVTDAEFKATGTVTNEAGATITVTNSKFIADEVDTSAENASFTVGGKSTLNITSLDGTIELLDSAEIRNSTVSNGGTLNVGTHEVESVATGNNVSFTGVNDFASTITNLGAITVTNATLKAASVDTSAIGASFTVGGVSTLNIGSLDGEITLVNIDIPGEEPEADPVTVNPTLHASIVSGGILDVSAGNLTFTGANTLNSVTLNAAGKTVTNSGTLTVDAATSVTADSISGSGAIVLSTDSVPSVRKETDALVSVTNGDLSSVTLKVGEETVGTFKKGITISGDSNSYTLVKAARSIYLTTQTQDTLYVNSGYDGSFGTITDDGFIVGYNAFANNSSLFFGNNTTQIVYSANPAEGNYGSLVLGTSAPNALTITTESVGEDEDKQDLVTMGALTTKAGSGTETTSVTLSGATMSLKDKIENETITAESIKVSAYSTLNIQATTADPVKASVVMAETVTNSGTVNVSGSTFNADGAVTNAATGEISVTDSTFKAGSVDTSANTASFTVGGKSTLNITSLDGEIKTAGAATTLKDSSITGKIDTNNARLGTITAQAKLTFATSATTKSNTLTNLTLTAQNDLDFTGANTLNSVTLNAAGKTVTVGNETGDSLTVGGTSTLNIGSLNGEITLVDIVIPGEESESTTVNPTLKDSSITGNGTNGTLTIQGALTFTGANALTDITLNAANKAVTVGNNDEIADSLTVGGTSTLNIGSKSGNEVTGGLTGTITLANGASLSDSVIYGGEINIANGTVVTVSGTNILSAITNSGTITVDGAMTAGAITNSGMITIDSLPTSSDTPVLTATSISNGYINVNFTSLTLTSYTLVSANLSGVSLKVNGTVVEDNTQVGEGYVISTKNNTGVFLFKGDRSTLWVNQAYSSGNCDGHTFSWDAFKDNAGGTAEEGKMTAEALAAASEIVYYASDTAYAALDLTAAADSLTITTESVGEDEDKQDLVTMGALTTKAGSETATTSVTLSGATMSLKDIDGEPITESIKVSAYSTLNVQATADPVKASVIMAETVTNLGTVNVSGSTFNANSVTTNAQGASFTVGGESTLEIGTLTGTIQTAADATLKDSSITGGGTNGGSISAQGALTFTGSNTLNSVTLTATVENTVVTVTGTGNSLTVGGESTLEIGTLTGTIKTAAGAKLKDSKITKGSISAQGALTFIGEDTLNSVTLNASGKTVTNSGTLTVVGPGKLTIGTLTNYKTIDVSNSSTVSATSLTNHGTAVFDHSRLQATDLRNDDPNARIEIKNSTVSVSNRFLNRKGIVDIKDSTVSGSGTSASLQNRKDFLTHNSNISFSSIKNTGTAQFYDTSITASSVVSKDTYEFQLFGTNSLHIGSFEGTIQTDSESAVTLNKSEITGKVDSDGTLLGVIKAQGALVFTGETKLNSMTLNANGKAVTVGNNDAIADSLTVGGTSTLDIGTLNGTIELADGAVITDSVISEVGKEGGTVKIVSGNVRFVGNNSFAAGITNSGTITMDVQNSELCAGSITNEADKTIIMNNNTILIANSVTNKGTLQVTNSTLTASELRSFTGSYYENSGELELADGSTFKYKFVDNLPSGEIEITDSTFTVTNTLNNEGSITLMAGTSSDQNVSTLNISGMSEISNAIQAGNYVTLKDSTVGSVYGAVKVQSGATLTLDGTNAITTLDLSEAAGATMDWQDKLTFTGFGDTYADKFTLDMSGYSYSGDGVGYLLLDSVNHDWTEEMYQSLLTNEWNPAEALYKFVVKDGDLYAMDHYFVATVSGSGNDAEAIAHPNNNPEYDFKTIATTISVSPDEIVVKDGTYNTSNNPVFNGIKTTIKGGEFKTQVGGGIVVESNVTSETTQIGSANARQDINFNITGGSFSKIVYAGDRLKGTSTVHRYGDITTTIDGGTFEYRVAGGMAYTLKNYNGNAKLFGDVTLNINGGTFKDWIFGGCIAATKVNGSQATITGNVTVNINASSNVISLASLAVGSQGPGSIGNGTNLVLTGKGSNLSVSGEIWGASTGGYYTVGDNRSFVSFVDGSEVLSFSGFTGKLKCTKIRGFDTVTCDETSKVGIDPNVSLSDVKNWTFEFGAWTEDEETVTSGISGNFTNDFTGDALELKGVGSLAVNSSWTVLENSKAGAFAGFGGESGDMTVKFYLNADDKTGTAMTWQSGGYYAAPDNSYKLALDNTDSPTRMILTRLA